MRFSLVFVFVFVFVAVAVAVAACSPAPAPVASSMHDPSNPNAPESVELASASTAAADAGPVTYTCPMHPEVTSDQPGRCPKCGMILVPKK